MTTRKKELGLWDLRFPQQFWERFRSSGLWCYIYYMLEKAAALVAVQKFFKIC